MSRWEARPIGPLTCRVSGPVDAGTTVVLLHGFGAPGTDLVPLGEELCTLRPALAPRVRWVFPEALRELPEGGPSARAWWRIDMPRWRALELRDETMLQRMREEVPPGMEEARAAVLALIAALRKESPATRLILGGFSQGAMLSTDVALRLAPPPAALIVFSGSLLNASEWRTLAAGHRGLPVFQSHGREDPLLPYDDAERVRDLLKDGGLEVAFLPFRGGHTLTLEVLEHAAALIERVAA